MSKLRSINTFIWQDTWFENLKPTAKLLFIYFITNERTNMLGIYEISLRKVSFETGINTKEVEEIISQFEKDGKVSYKENRIILLNFLKHQNYNFNMKKSAIDAYNDLPNSLKIENQPVIEKSDNGFETLAKGFGMVRKIEVEVEIEYELEVEKELEIENLNTKKFNFKNSLIDFGFKENLVLDWLVVRKNKKATNTETAFKKFTTEVLKSKRDINEILELCVIKSWGGFESEWLNNLQPEKPKQQAHNKISL